MFTEFRRHWNTVPEYGFRYLEEVPAVFHCHHFNLFLDQTIDDAMGKEEGARLKTRAARDAWYQLLEALGRKLGVNAPADRIMMAQTLVAQMGHGGVDLRLNPEGEGDATSRFAHYGFCWKEKYGGKVHRRHPADPVLSGFVAAATAWAFGNPPGDVFCAERACVAMDAEACAFDVVTGADVATEAVVERGQTLSICKGRQSGLREEEISAIATGLVDFTSANLADERGLVQAFGVFVTLHMANYYNRVSYDALSHISEKSPQLVGVLESLLRESGHVCVFNTFGGILLSPEWEALVGPLTGEPEDIVVGCLAIARGLGFGHWTLVEYEPERRLVIRTPATYESAWYCNLEERASQPTCYMFQGAGLAVMQLAHKLDWLSRPSLDQELYNSLFRPAVGWKVEETACLAMGDDYDEVTVSAQ